MRKLNVNFLKTVKGDTPVRRLSVMMDTIDREGIGICPWPHLFNYKPKVSFAIAYTDDCIFLKYYVKERSVLAKYLHTNDLVYEDSCVEFFVAFNGEPGYYNFEFNCLGTCLAGFGETRETRKLLPKNIIEKIRYCYIIQKEQEQAETEWELMLVIPLEVFCNHRLSGLKGQKCTGNFYKCGDHLPQPHFLSWAAIQSPEPNFHLPEFFGEIRFV